NDQNLSRHRQIDREEPIDDGPHGPGLVVNGNDDRETFRVTAHRRLAGAGFGGGAGLYSSMTLLITAMGRPGAVKLSAPSTRTTDSLSPSILTPFSSASTTNTMCSEPVGATAFSPPGPLPPLIRSTRSAAVRNSF